MEKMLRFPSSLRARLLVPLAACSILSAIVVGAMSRAVSDRAVEQEMRSQFDAIRMTLRNAQFPLTAPVLTTLADLTGTELATYDAQGRPLHSTIDSPPARWLAAEDTSPPAKFRSDAMRGYLAQDFARVGGRGDGVARVLVMYDTQKLSDARRAAALLPLTTGLFSALLVGGVALIISRRMIARIEVLRANVQQVAAGNFAPGRLVSGDDELSQLGDAIHGMSHDLRMLWQTVKQHERQKLMHQLAAGLAHQLRNSLTGARMALDWHADQWQRLAAQTQSQPSAAIQSPTQPNPNQPQQRDALTVARHEIQRTQDYVQRILNLAQKPDATGQPATVQDALQSVHESLQIIARHHQVTLNWELDAVPRDTLVRDGASLAMAIENLLLNAIEAGGKHVQLSAALEADQLLFTVRDDGPGLPQAAAEKDPAGNESADVFEPFVTSKPEGLGLGLTLVQQAAKMLGGDLNTARQNGWTQFCLRAAIQHADELDLQTRTDS